MKTCLLTFLALVALLCLVVGAVAWTLYAPPEPLVVRRDTRQQADCIIVAGGVSERARTAAQHYKEGLAPRIIVSGKDTSHTDRRVLLAAGVPAKAIIEEPESTSTWENAVFCRPLLKEMNVKSAILVTSSYHSARTYATFRHVIPEVRFISLPDETPISQDTLRNYHRREILKRIGYFWQYGVPLFVF